MVSRPRFLQYRCRTVNCGLIFWWLNECRENCCNFMTQNCIQYIGISWEIIMLYKEIYYSSDNIGKISNFWNLYSSRLSYKYVAIQTVATAFVFIFNFRESTRERKETTRKTRKLHVPSSSNKCSGQRGRFIAERITRPTQYTLQCVLRELP